MSLRIIIVGGIAIFVIMALIPLAMKQGLKPDPRQRVQVVADLSPFDGEAAYRHVEALVGFGPRPAGSEAAGEARRYIQRCIRELGFRVEVVAGAAGGGSGQPALQSLVCHVPGKGSRVVLLGTHYDTYGGSDPPSVGAHDGASGVAVLLELGRAAGRHWDGPTLLLCFWDGGEEDGGGNAGMRGSTAHLTQWAKEGRLNEVDAAFVVDAVGDCYLGIQDDPIAPEWLREAVESSVNTLGYGRHFLATGDALMGDHLSLRHHGIPTMLLTDSRFGGSVVQHRQNWHTAEDTLDKVCPGSLQAIGDVIYHALLKMDALLPRAT